ncbi:MAG: cytochrome c551/c552, partial [Planctomycetota bacterium]
MVEPVFPSLALAALCLLVAPASAHGLSERRAPALPGLASANSLSGAERGRVAIEELRCTACHADQALSVLPALPGPDLTEVSWRLQPDFVRNFLSSPATHDPGTRMPDVLVGHTEEERTVIADALTHYLFSLSAKPQLEFVPTTKAHGQGATLFHSAGCIACHSPRRSMASDEDDLSEDVRDVGLGHIAGKYRGEGLADFLFQPSRTRPDGRMPDMGLSRDEAVAIASYLVPKAQVQGHEFVVDKGLRAQGELYFAELGCAGCHPMADAGNVLATSLDRLDTSAGCLSDEPAAGVDYALSQDQVGGIRQALASLDSYPATDSQRIAHGFAALNCTACHTRDGDGGPSRGR